MVANPARGFGFTMLELLLVLVVLSLLAGLAAPMVSNAIIKSKEAALMENLQVMRSALDDYYADKGLYPDSGDLLVDEKYIRFVPEDPMTQTTEWDWVESDDPEITGISDVRSLSGKQALDGSNYSDW